jgi:hypothetical protein
MRVSLVSILANRPSFKQLPHRLKGATGAMLGEDDKSMPGSIYKLWD